MPNIKRYQLFDKFQLFSLFGLVCFPVLSTAMQSFTIIFFVLFSVIKAIIHKDYSFEKENIAIFLFGSVWILFLGFTLFYSLETNLGIKYLKRLINIVLIPFSILFLYPKLNKEHIILMMKLFVLSNFILLFYFIFYIFTNISDKEIGSYSELIWYGIKQVKNEPSLLFHKTYFSMQLLLSQYFLLVIIKKRIKDVMKGLAYFFLILNVGLIFFLFSKINVFLLFIATGFYLVFIQKSKKRKIVAGLFYSSLLALTFVFAREMVRQDSFLEKNILKKTNLVINFFTESSIDSNLLDSRALIYKCARSLIKERPILGYGIGSQQMYLNDCYAENGNYVLYNNNYNSHNYFYFLLLSGGIIACLLFFLMLIYFVKYAIENNNKILLFFLILFGVNLLFENILSRINGVLLFAVFYPLIIRFKEKS